MNIDEAILKAADHIERHPESYDFGYGLVSRSGGALQCMLARIGQCAGVAERTHHEDVARAVLGLSVERFYAAILHCGAESVHDRDTIPPAMRKFAKKYEGIPVGVSDIFKPGVIEKALEVTP